LFIGSLYERLSHVYSTQERLPAAEVPDEFTPHLVKYRFRKEVQGWPLIQVGPGVATLNYTDSYRWELFRESALQLWRELEEVYPKYNAGVPAEFLTYQLRFINGLALGPAGPLRFLQEFLHTGISLPVEVQTQHVEGPESKLILSIDYPLNRVGASGAIRFGTALKLGEPAIVWELVVSSDGSVDSAVGSDFAGWLDYAHEVIEDWFFTFIEGELLRRFGGGPGVSGG